MPNGAKIWQSENKGNVGKQPRRKKMSQDIQDLLLTRMRQKIARRKLDIKPLTRKLVNRDLHRM